MIDSVNPQNDAPLETSVPVARAPLQSILRTEELFNRPSRPPDHMHENSALIALARALADSPRTILQTLADKVLEVLHADSAGLSLLTKDEKRFYWAAIAGAWGPHVGGGTPRDFGPCGDVLDHNVPMLFSHWERRYPYLSAAVPLSEEGLLVPFYVSGKAVGTIWAIAHSNRRKFDLEDLRLLDSMSRFASAAYQTMNFIEELKLEIIARETAELELRGLTNSLEAQIRARTEELRQRNGQLAEAKVRLAEEKRWLERSEAYMAEAQKLSHCGSWHLNVRTGKINWSQETFAILGIDQKTQPSYSLFLERVHPEDRSKLDQVQSAAIQEKKDFEAEFRLLLPGGLIKYVHSIGHCSERDSGTGKYVGAMMDITERRQAQERVRRSEAFLAEGQRLSLTGSFSWRVDTDEIAFSGELRRIFRFEQDETVTLERIGARIHPEDVTLLCEKVGRARRGIEDHDYEIRLRLPNDSVKYVRMIAHGIRHQDGRLEYLGAVQDVTERRLSEQTLGNLRSELAHTTRVMSLGALTASVAHEVNQPLSGIITNASTCLRMLSADPPNVDGARETARRTIRDGNRASDVITRLRALFSKKDTATEAVDLNEATQEVLELSRGELQRNRVILQSEFADDLPQVRVDRVQLQQVILNLLRNASDAMSGVDNRPRQLVIRTERDEGDHVRLSVQDAGVGFEPNDANRLFKAFYTTKSGGMGIGLSVSRSIIESHNGRLWATPNDGPGSTFSFSIPFRRDRLTGGQSYGATPTTVARDAERAIRT